MSEDKQFPRRDVLKLSGAALATSMAGCSGGAQENNDTPTEQSNSGDGILDDTQTQTDTGNNDYTPRIKHGEEFEWFIDTRRLDDENLLIDDLPIREEWTESLSGIPWQIYRTQDAINEMNPDIVDQLDERAPQVTGRGFVDANYSDIGSKVVLGLGEIGAVDVKGMSPDQINEALEENFEQREQRNGRTIYEGSFTDRRFGYGMESSGTPYDEETYEVKIGHENEGNNIIWVADRPVKRGAEGRTTPFLNEIETPYKLLDQATKGNLPSNEKDRQASLMDGNSHLKDKAEVLQQNWSDDEHELHLVFSDRDFDPVRAQDDEGAGVGVYRTYKVNGDVERQHSGYIVRRSPENYDLEVYRTTPWDLEEMETINFVPYY